MVSQASSGASWALLLILMVFLAEPGNAAPEKDRITDLSLLPSTVMIGASWWLANPSGRVTSFKLMWINVNDLDKHLHTCPVKYPMNETKYYNTENDCDGVPQLRSNTLYEVIVQGLNSQTVVITETAHELGHTFSDDQLTDLSLQPAHYMIAASWQLMYSTGQIVTFQVKWTRFVGASLVVNNCTVKYRESVNQHYSTDQCDQTPTLQPSTKYFVLVEGLNNQSYVISRSKRMIKQTLSQSQSVNPSNHTDQLTDLSLHSRPHMIAASWRLLNLSGEVTSFRVLWKSPSGQDEQYPNCTVQCRGSTDQQYSTDQCDETPTLHHCTGYEVKVLGANKQSKTITESVWMPGNTLSEVTNLTVTSSADNILVQWTLDTSCSTLNNYAVKWGSEGGDINTDYLYTKRAKNDTLQYLVRNLPQCSFRHLTVTPYDTNDRSIGPPAAIEVYSAPRVTKLATTTVTGARSIALFWLPPETKCNVTVYFITYDGEAKWGGRQRHNGSVVVGQGHVESVTNLNNLTGLTLNYTQNDQDGLMLFNYTVRNLVPHSVYNVCVTAANQEGNGTKNCLQNIQTKEAEPSAPTSLTLNSTAHNITAQWYAPSSANGIVRSYNVSWHCGNGSSYKIEITTSFTIGWLPACVECTVKVAASTGAGEGRSSEAMARTLPEAPDSVTKLTNTSVGARFVALTWQRPNTRCNITTYHITYYGTAMWGEEHLHNDSVSAQEHLKNATYYVNLTNLVPYSSYNVCIVAKNQEGNSSMNCLTDLQTEEAKPSAPTSLTLNSTAHNITAQWYAPSNTSGIVRSYNVSWHCGNDSSYKIENKTSFTIEALPASVECTVKVAASTGAGEGRSSEATTRTLSEGHPVALIVGGILATVVLTAAIMTGVILWRRRQSKIVTRERTLSAEDSYFLNLLHRAQTKTKELRTECNLIKEFLDLENGNQQGTTKTASSRENKTKNRFINTLPYDSHRVQLKRLASNSTDYINASIIPTPFDDDVSFIACQGPLDDTVDDFWWMIWERDASTIVMLANCVEDGRQRCAAYWPSTPYTQMDNSSFTIRVTETVQRDHYILRTITLENGEEVKRVSQFHFTKWPDHGVPESCEELLTIVKDIKNQNLASCQDVVVHCSAGVGRTGTFIALWRLQTAAERRDPAVDVRMEVLAIRRFRMNLVQSPTQYVFLHDCFLAYLENRERWTPGTGGDDVDSPLLRGTAAIRRSLVRSIREANKKYHQAFKKKTTEPDEESYENVRLQDC